MKFRDSFSYSVSGERLDIRSDDAVDPGPWGRSTLVSYRPGEPNQALNPQSLVKGNVEITPARGEPCLRTYTLSLERRIEQLPEVGNTERDQAANVHVVAVVKYGVGGAQHVAEISVRDGVSFAVPSSGWEVSAYIEPMPDMSSTDPADFYPNDSTGPKRVLAYCSAALGTRQGGSILPVRYNYWRMPDAEVNPLLELPIPQSAVSVRFGLNNVVHALTDFEGEWLGPNNGVIGMLDMTADNPIPAGAYFLDLKGPALSDKSVLLSIEWQIYL